MFQSHTADKFTIITQVFTLPEETKQKENIETFVPAKWCQLVQYSSVGEHKRIFHQESASGTLETYRKLLSIHLPAEWVTPRCLGSGDTPKLGKLLEVLLVVMISFGFPLCW